MKKIPLTQGKSALVDDEDFERLNHWKWHAAEDGNTFYARSRKGGLSKTQVPMHRDIIGAKTGQIVDHIDGNGLNNQKSNLRICTNSENILNVRDLQSRNTSGVSGVSWCRREKRWFARVQVAGKRKVLGYFQHLEDAAMAVINYQPKQK